MAWYDWLKENVYNPIFDPGADQRARAEALSNRAVGAWEPLVNDAPALMMPGPREYALGDPLEAAREDYLTPDKAAALGMQTESAAKDKTSAWDPLSSAYENAGPSAYNALWFDPRANLNMQAGENYFGALAASGYDPISEADYARGRTNAEQARRAQVEAALADAEMRGVGGVGAGLQAELVSNQQMSNDLYQEGLDRAAAAAKRRDEAATTGADISERRGRALLDADSLRAQGLDEYEINRLTGLDTFAGDKAAGQDDFMGKRWAALDDWARGEREDYYGVSERNADRTQSTNEQNWDRGNTVNDANVDLENEYNWYKYNTYPQQQFNNRVTAAGGLSNAAAGAATSLGNLSTYEESPFKVLAEGGSKIAKASAGGGGATA